MSDFALLFPGQGSHAPDMREVVESSRPDLLAAVVAAMGEDPFERAAEDTRFAQPAIFCAGLSYWEAAGRPEPGWVAGHSLGELAALVVAGVLSEHDGLRLVVLRGRLMSEAVSASGGGAMLALLGASPPDARAIAARARVTVANDNAPGQVVLSGPAPAIESARLDAVAGGVRTLSLPLAGAFHTAAMRPAADAFAGALDETEVRAARVPVLCCATARPFADVRSELAEGIVAPVRWRETLLALYALGASRFVDAGPGKALAGMARRTVRGAVTETLATREPAHA